jgi:hypothetical protein
MIAALLLGTVTLNQSSVHCAVRNSTSQTAAFNIASVDVSFGFSSPSGWTPLSLSLCSQRAVPFLSSLNTYNTPILTPMLLLLPTYPSNSRRPNVSLVLPSHPRRSSQRFNPSKVPQLPNRLRPKQDPNAAH